jgi:hypothetical protein
MWIAALSLPERFPLRNSLRRFSFACLSHCTQRDTEIDGNRVGKALGRRTTNAFHR